MHVHVHLEALNNTTGALTYPSYVRVRITHLEVYLITTVECNISPTHLMSLQLRFLMR